jgi:mRNA interferase RelE/StbE
MNIKIHTTFLKELARLPKKEREVVEKFLFKEIISIDNMDEIPDIRKLKGYNNYFRIRFGNYRA